ncbi:MAG: glycosyltransferase 87 family protein [Acidobacteriota bacterium]
MLESYLQAVTDLEDRFAAAPGRRDLMVALALFLTSFCALAVAAPEGFASADAAVYLQQIREADFQSRPTHVGYYVLGWLWTAVLGASEKALNLMSAGFGALAVALIWLHASRLMQDRRAAGFAVAAALTHSLLVQNALHAEVYMAEAALLLAALHLWLRKRHVAAGLLLALAGLVTPSAVFVAPAFVLLRPRWRPLAVLVATAGLGVALGIAPLGTDYFSGGRGLLSGASAHLGLLGGIKKEGMEVVLGASATLLWVAAGVVVAAVRSFLRPWLLALCVAWAAGFVLGERFGDVPVQLPLHLWACCLVGVAIGGLPVFLKAFTKAKKLAFWSGASALAAAPPALVFLFRHELQAAAGLPASAWLTLALVVLLAGLACSLVSEPRRGLEIFGAITVLATLLGSLGQARALHRGVVDYRDAVLAKTTPEPLAIGGWSPGILFEHYRYGESYTDNWIDRRELDESARLRLESALAEGREIWLLDGPLPSEIADRLEGAEGEPRGPVTVLGAR